MADVERRASDKGVAPAASKIEFELAGQDNAVGYREYVEALDLDVSDREVRQARMSATGVHGWLTGLSYQYTRVRWKLDLTILPMFLITQALQFMDKTSLNYANLFGYQEALGLQGRDFNYLSASESEVLPYCIYCYTV
jgi:hypothetical protein